LRLARCFFRDRVRQNVRMKKNTELIPWLKYSSEAEQAACVLVDVMDELKPMGAVEGVLVERIAYLSMRLRTANVEALRAEASDRREAQTITEHNKRTSRMTTLRDPGKARDLGMISRYEGGVQRQLLVLLRELRKLQDARRAPAPDPKRKVGE
jgi:hypothetical protein